MLAGQQNWIENYFSKDIIATNRFGQNRKIGSLRKFITARKRSLGQGNVFTLISDSVHGEGGYPWQRPPMDRDPPWTETPSPGQRPLWTETPLYRDPLDRDPLPAQRPPCTDPPAQRPPARRTPLHRAPWTETPWTKPPYGKDPIGMHSCLKLSWLYTIKETTCSQIEE